LKKDLSDVSEEEIEKFYRQVSINVREARTKANMSQLDLALKLGIKSIAFYSNCENIRYNKHFNLEHIYKISKALNINLEDIFKNTDIIL